MLANNDIFKKVKVAAHGLADLSDKDCIECFKLGGYEEMSIARLDSWKCGETNKRHKPMPDEALEAYLNGLVEFSRK